MGWANRTLVVFLTALWLVLTTTAFAGSPSASSGGTPTGATPAAVIRISGEVDDFMRDNLLRRFHQAESDGAQTVILEIDTYGGMVTSAMDISRFLRGQLRVHTVALVDSKAISAGAMIALACDEIVMTPSAILGDCAPIMIDRTGNMAPVPATERAKMQSPVLRDFAESAARNGYSPLVAEAMVRVETSVYLVADAGGHTRAVDADQYKQLTENPDSGWKPAPGVANPVDGPDTLLTVGPDLAQKLGLCRSVVASSAQLAAERNYNIVADLTPTFGDRLVEAMGSTGGRFLLLVVFLLSLYIALHAPGHGAAEAFAILSLGLLVGVPMLTGYAQWWELALIFVGLALCAFELFVFPGHGLSLVLGAVMLLLGLLLTFAGRDPGPGWLPSSAQTWHHLRHGLVVMCSAFVTSAALAAIISPYLPRLPLFRKLILTETSDGSVRTVATGQKAGQDQWPFVGTVGVAATDLKPGGVVQFPYGSDTRNAPVVSTGGFVSAGTKVLVQEARGNRIVVSAV